MWNGYIWAKVAESYSNSYGPYVSFQDGGRCYTVKEYKSKKQFHEDGWEHKSIVLKPRTDDPSYSELVLGGEEGSMFQVIGTFECVL